MSTRRLTPEKVRGTRFERTAFGRRGYREDEVDSFLARVSEEIAAYETETANLRAEIERLRNYYRDHGVDPARAPRTAKPTDEAVQLLAQAQQQADQYVAQAQDYCRRLIAQAREYADQVLADAHRGP